MSYSAITTQEINVGGPVQNPTLAKIQQNEDYFNTQIAALSSSINNPKPIKFVIKGDGQGYATPLLGFAYERVWANMTLTAGQIWIPVAGGSGTVQVDVQYKRGVGGTWASIFSTKPSSPWTDGDGKVTTNGVLSVTSLLAGDFLRLDISSVQASCKEFQVELPFIYA